MLHSLCFATSLLALASAIVLPRDGAPTVALAYSTFKGFASANNTQSFLGMRYAQAPIGDLRFRLPLAPLVNTTVQDATTFGNNCPQQNYSLPPIQGVSYAPLSGLLASGTAGEDCLFINVVKPVNVTGKVPVVVWFYGGGFVTGSSSAYNGTQIVARSVALGQPVIYVSMNYRVNMFGFIGGKEVAADGLGNLGLRDQYLALKWIQQYISSFGGDATKVTLWGQSAGSISVLAHMVHSRNEGLFRAAFMQSGYASPMTPITSGKHQFFFDAIVNATGCTSSTSQLGCLRALPYDNLMTAINNQPQLFSDRGLNLTWSIGVDGSFFTETLKKSIKNGNYAKIPLITGDTDDEGTMFSLQPSLSMTTDAQFRTFVHDYFFNTNDSAIALIAAAYPDDPTAGSPFDTGTLYNITAEYKRLAAFQGDVIMQSPRRALLSVMSKTQNTWSYLTKSAKAYPYLGSVHGVDIAEVYGTGTSPDYFGTDALINLATNLNPNAPAKAPLVPSRLSGFNWPLYSNSTTAPPMVLMTDPQTYGLTTDTYRTNATNLIAQLSTDLGL